MDESVGECSNRSGRRSISLRHIDAFNACANRFAARSSAFSRHGLDKFYIDVGECFSGREFFCGSGNSRQGAKFAERSLSGKLNLNKKVSIK